MFYQYYGTSVYHIIYRKVEIINVSISEQPRTRKEQETKDQIRLDIQYISAYYLVIVDYGCINIQ